MSDMERTQGERLYHAVLKECVRAQGEADLHEFDDDELLRVVELLWQRDEGWGCFQVGRELGRRQALREAAGEIEKEKGVVAGPLAAGAWLRARV